MNLDLADLKLLSTVARHLSFRMAAQELGLSASAVSHAVRSIEERLGVRMFSRTTRSVVRRSLLSKESYHLKPAGGGTAYGTGK